MIFHRFTRSDAGLILVLSLLPLLFFWRLITPFPVDQMNVAAGDFTEQYFPLRAFTAREWVQGRVPLWNPYLYGGQPALADIQSGALYPLHVGQALLLGWGSPLLGREIGFPVKALEWQMILHFSIAAVGVYLFARHLFVTHGFALRSAQVGAAVAALGFTYSGYLTGFPVQQITILAVSTWLPWVLWGIDAAARYSLALSRAAAWRSPALKGCLRSVAGAALAFAMVLLAGHPQTALYVFYLSLAYALFVGVTHKPMAWWQRLARTGTTWLVVVLLGTAVAAAQLLPTLAFIANSVRADLSYQAVSSGLPLAELISILYPGFFGGSPEYVGIVSVVLAALAVTIAITQVKLARRGLLTQPAMPSSQIFFWMSAGLLGLLLAFGNNLFLYPLFYLLAPGFDLVRQQERAFLIFNISAALLAGYGSLLLVGPLPTQLRRNYRRFTQNLGRLFVAALFMTGLFIYGSTAATARGDAVNLFYGVLWHHLFGLIILAGVLGLMQPKARRWLRRGWGALLLLLWIAFNLFTINWRFNLAQPEETSTFTPNGPVQFLQQTLETQAPTRIVSGGLLPGGNSAGSVYRLPDLTGNTPLQLARMNTFLQQMPAWRLWQLMNVRYVIAGRDIGDAGLRPVFAEGSLQVFEIVDPFQRAWLVSATEHVADDEQALTRLADDSVDLRTTAVVARPLPDTAALEPVPATAQVVVKKISPTHLGLSVNASGRHLLVISQVFDAGWQATVDGQPVDVLRVNLGQQGVLLPAGATKVDLIYWPENFTLGLIISFTALFCCVGLLGFTFLDR